MALYHTRPHKKTRKTGLTPQFCDPLGAEWPYGTRGNRYMLLTVLPA